MRREWKRFGSALGWLFGAAGLAVAADAHKVLWAFVAVLVLAVVYAWGRPAGRRIADVVVRVRNYPTLLRTAAEAQGENSVLKNEIANLQRAVVEARHEGWTAGAADMRGAVIAGLAGAPPRLIAISIMKEDVVLVAAATADANSVPQLGAMYNVAVEGTQEVKGVVVVTVRNVDSRQVQLNCVQRTVPRFWDRLRDDAEANPTPPRGIELVHMTFPAEHLPWNSEV